MTAATLLNEAQFDTLHVEVSDEILTITINRPKSLNALSAQVIRELRSVLSTLREHLGQPDATGGRDWSIRGIIVTGSGDKAFVAGADIAEMNGMTSDDAREYARIAQEATSWLETLPVPVVAAVNGYALGGGCELALACDVIFASRNAVFGQPEVQLGLIPGFGGTVRLQRVIGPQLARDLIFSGRSIKADEAERLGLAARVYDDTATLLEGARDFLSTVAAKSPVAVAAAKRTIREVEALDTDAGLAVELTAFSECFDTEDMREGTQAFLEKRSPDFAG